MTRSTRLLTALLTIACAAPLAGCSSGSDATAPAATTPAATVEATTFAPSLGIDLTAAGWTRTSADLFYRTLVSAPSGAAAVTNGQQLSVRYTGRLANATPFDSSTINFQLGAGQVIAGWDQGIVGMHVGEQRRLLIPPALGYGAQGVYVQGTQVIPGNAVLVFDVTVLSAN